MSTLHLTAPDYLVIGGYFVLVLWIGFYFRKQLQAARDYFAGGHQIPWWLAGISHYMSSFSAFAFVAYAQTAYQYGWVSVTLFWASAPACALGGLFFARRWRRARVITPVQFLESRFSPFMRQLFAWAGIPVKIFDDALKVFATGLFVSLGVGMNLHSAIVLCAAVMIVYTFLGGLWALVVTDYVQFLMKALAIILLFPLAIWSAGGLTAATSGLPAGFFHLSGGPYGWTYIIGFFLLIAISYNASWALAQKYYSVPSERDARKAAYLAGALNLVGAPIMILPAMLARKFLPDLIAQHRTADTYVLLVLKLLPVGMVGIIVAAMFSATMAAVSADFNAIASVLTKDVYHRLINPRASESRLLSVGRWTTMGLGLITLALSIWIALSHQESLFHIMVTAFGLFLAPTFLPLLAGLTVRGLTWKGAFTGFCAGLTVGATTLALKTWYLPTLPGLSPEWTNYTFEGISILLNIGVTVIGMWLGSVLLSEEEADRQRRHDFFAALDEPIAAKEMAGSKGISATPVIAGATLGVGGLLATAGLLSGSATARSIDVATGAILGLIGVLFYRKGRLANRRSEASAP